MTISRRTFLGGLGAGAIASAGSSLLAPNRAVAQRSGSRVFVIREDRFGRIFPSLRPFADSSPRLLNTLKKINKPGDLLDAGDDLATSPIALIIDPALSANNPNNTTHTASTTFINQFLDH